MPLSSRCSGRLPRLARRRRAARCAPLVGLLLLAGGCTEVLDAGHNRPHGMLPVDERNPVILYQDNWSGDWLGEYAALFANTGGPPIAGIVVNASAIWSKLSINVSGWNDLVAAARASGLKNIPDVTASTGDPLTRPANGQIDSTTPNRSEGAQLIVDVSRRLATAARPVVVVSASSLTDIADAYLIDPTVAERVVVVAVLGGFAAPNGIMGAPNGDLDPWADWIVARHFRYVQVSSSYDQTGDITMSQVSSLPQNALGARFEKKRADIIPVLGAADQVALLSVALPRFVVEVIRVSPDLAAPFNATQGPPLVPNAAGNAWVVTRIAPPLAAARLWMMLLDPQTFGS